MPSNGRISVLVSTELQTLVSAVQGMDEDVRGRIRKHTTIVVEPVWKERVRGQVKDRLQTRVLSDTAGVAVSDLNVVLKSGGIGTMANGTPKSALVKGVEFGADRKSTKELVSKTGKRFKRRTKAQFHLPRSRGYVVYPAAREIIPRIASLWIQTTIRTAYETFEKGGVGRG